jgi:hypothetical protein
MRMHLCDLVLHRTFAAAMERGAEGNCFVSRRRGAPYGAEEQEDSRAQERPLYRDWVRRDPLDSLGRRPSSATARCTTRGRSHPTNNGSSVATRALEARNHGECRWGQFGFTFIVILRAFATRNRDLQRNHGAPESSPCELAEHDRCDEDRSIR